MAAELLDTARWSTNGGERGYGDGAAAVASAMAGEREGEELGRRGDVRRGSAETGRCAAAAWRSVADAQQLPADDRIAQRVGSRRGP